MKPWPHNTSAMLYQLSYEATDIGSWSIVGSYVPVKEMSVNDIWNKSYMNYGNEMKMKKWSSQWTQFMQLRKEARNIFQNINHWLDTFQTCGRLLQFIIETPRVCLLFLTWLMSPLIWVHWRRTNQKISWTSLAWQ